MAEEKGRRAHLIEELGKSFLKTNALKIGDFRTSTGTRTPYYIDLKTTISFPNALSLVVDCLGVQLEEIERKSRIDYLCGVPVTGLIFSSILSHDKSKPMVYSSKEPSSHRLVGIMNPGAEVLIVDDVSETGKSMETAAMSIRANGGVVSNAMSLIDRMEGAKETLSSIGITLHFFTTTHELAMTLRDKLALSEDEIELVDSASSQYSGASQA